MGLYQNYAILVKWYNWYKKVQLACRKFCEVWVRDACQPKAIITDSGDHREWLVLLHQDEIA